MTKPLSPTQTQILTAATDHAVGLAASPPELPVAARTAVFRSMLNSGLLEEVPAPADHPELAWRQEGDGSWIALRITEAGRRAVGIGPEPLKGVDEAARGEHAEGVLVLSPAAQEAPLVASTTPAVPSTLRAAATALLAAWDAGEERSALPAIDALRAALGSRSSPTRPARSLGASRIPREGTKQQAVLTLLHRIEGATVAQIMDATGWAPHTVRGFFAGLKRKGHTVEGLERVRRVGPGKHGAKGSYSVYRIVEAG
jgi:hypothetical protein